MLSKYYYAEQCNINSDKVDMNLFISSLVDILREKYDDIKIEQTTPVGKGTLGIFIKRIIYTL